MSAMLALSRMKCNTPGAYDDTPGCPDINKGCYHVSSQTSEPLGKRSDNPQHRREEGHAGELGAGPPPATRPGPRAARPHHTRSHHRAAHPDTAAGLNTQPPSCPGLTRASRRPHAQGLQPLDCRIKPGNDKQGFPCHSSRIHVACCKHPDTENARPAWPDT